MTAATSRRQRLRRDLAERWAETARSRSCVACGGPPPSCGHHVVYQQTVRRECRTLGLEFAVVRFDVRNLMGVCGRCHDRHHSRSRPISARLLSADNWEFASWLLGMERARAYVERRYA